MKVPESVMLTDGGIAAVLAGEPVYGSLVLLLVIVVSSLPRGGLRFSRFNLV